MTKYLISKGADVNTRDNNGITPLHWCAVTGKSLDINFFFEFWKLIHTDLSLSKLNDFLIKLIWLGNENVTKLLIGNNADVNVNYLLNISTPLHWSAIYGNFPTDIWNLLSLPYKFVQNTLNLCRYWKCSKIVDRQWSKCQCSG